MKKPFLTIALILGVTAMNAQINQNTDSLKLVKKELQESIRKRNEAIKATKEAIKELNLSYDIAKLDSINRAKGIVLDSLNNKAVMLHNRKINNKTK